MINSKELKNYLVLGLFLSGILLSLLFTQNIFARRENTGFVYMEAPLVVEKDKSSSLPLEAKKTGTKTSLPAKPEVVPFSSPKVLRASYPVYPQEALDNNIEGVVVLDLNISEKGLVSNVSLNSSSGNKILDDSAINAVSSWIFDPAKKGLVAVESMYRVPIRFFIKK